MADEHDPKAGPGAPPPTAPPGDGESAGQRLERFLGTPTRDLDDWFWLWQGDHPFPLRRRPGLLGRLIAGVKRLLRPVVRLATAELWDRQRVFNLILIERLIEESRHRAQLEQHLRAVHRDHQAAIEAHARRLEELDVRVADGLRDVLGHNDALFARVDQKLDLYRREARRLHGRLGALVAAQEQAAASPAAVSEVLTEQAYGALEHRCRGSREEIRRRLRVYVPYLEERAPVLDLGCGRGEALELLAEHGIAARGVDASGEMVARCREHGLTAVQGDLFDHLAGEPEESLGGVVSFHVVEHLQPAERARLVHLAWRALRPGGVLILETPSPLSLVAGARNFWADPTHLRPVHPASLEVLMREAGFEPIHRLDLQPFPASDRLPEIELDDLPGEQRALADGVNRLRDALDDLLYGNRDFALVGHKP